jgi:hypothetical protein
MQVLLGLAASIDFSAALIVPAIARNQIGCDIALINFDLARLRRVKGKVKIHASRFIDAGNMSLTAQNIINKRSKLIAIIVAIACQDLRNFGDTTVNLLIRDFKPRDGFLARIAVLDSGDTARMAQRWMRFLQKLQRLLDKI